MARKIKVYGTTTVLTSRFLEGAHARGLSQWSRQVRIICGATSMAEANRLCEAQGLYGPVFRSNCTSGTKNATEVGLAKDGGIFVAIQAPGSPVSYYSLEDLAEQEAQE